MAYDINDLLRRPITGFERFKADGLAQELTDAQWAFYGRRVSDNLNKPDELEQIFMNLALSGADTKTIMRLIRVYIITGVKP